MFNPAEYRRMYARFLGPLSSEVTFMINNGTSFDDYAEPVFARVTNWQESDLVPGGTIELGDLKLIIPVPDILDTQPPFPRLELKDRIRIGGRAYSVIHWDEKTRSVGDYVIAVQVTVRG